MAELLSPELRGAGAGKYEVGKYGVDAYEVETYEVWKYGVGRGSCRR
ncbi:MULTISPECIES: hypothetical protein [unclassified Streptomyces]